MNTFSYLLKPKVMLSGLVLAVALAVGYGFVVSSNLSASTGRDCSPNSILKANVGGGCGTMSASEFRTDYKTNKEGDLPAIYNHFGLQSGEIDRFASSAKKATAYKDGRIVVDGQTVATDAYSIGRQQITGNNQKFTIGGKTYWGGPNSGNFGSSSIPAYVMFNDDGLMEFAVLTSCGNPTNGKKVTPKYSCDKLNMNPVSGKKNTYNFTTNATATNNAKIVKVIYDFGDGSAKVEKTKPSDVVTHTYAKPGNYTAKVTVVVSLPGGKTKTVTGVQCTKPVKVEEEKKPFFACKNLVVTTINKEEREYRFTVTSEQRDGPKLAKADFNFGDGQSVTGVAPTNENTAMATHKYAKDLEGTVNITATVYATSGDKDANDNKCVAKLDFKAPPPEECKPGVPVGDERCEEKPEAPQVLPSTGPAEIIGGTLGLGSIVAAGSYYVSSRRNLLDLILKR
ncbi:MAG: PKD domain-containing protein [Candidatus Saccharimonadales bacterium]